MDLTLAELRELSPILTEPGPPEKTARERPQGANRHGGPWARGAGAGPDQHEPVAVTATLLDEAIRCRLSVSGGVVVTAGYSGTPLAKKLGIKAGHVVATVNEPPEFRSLLVDLADDVRLDGDLADRPDIVVAFYTDHADLDADLASLADAVFPERVIWLAWPKKTAGVATDLTGDVVRASVLATTLVDVKVCAISDVWSGLKVVWRKEHRG